MKKIAFASALALGLGALVVALLTHGEPPPYPEEKIHLRPDDWLFRENFKKYMTAKERKEFAEMSPATKSESK